MFEELVVYSAVACAATYATWRLVPGAVRVALVEGCVRLAQRVGFAQPDTELRNQRARANGSGCGGCSGCARKPIPRSVAMVTKTKTKDP
ncbi:conserved hypothetical protein [Candidatus Accumulibacter aalborgensis]|uniref:Uncharacterized protein n=1 Tax=Candidatus Accumulibacter aalborgensis TaxID=1860102 RepID=A0A1A8XGM4_9PROT|nr:hypothetical protein [Candidatus Accumulibacter aalborgensis]SBT03088.1 conserved hypothetical protein [Candidatus Accumulibacter aalborgensis]